MKHQKGYGKTKMKKTKTRQINGFLKTSYRGRERESPHAVTRFWHPRRERAEVSGEAQRDGIPLDWDLETGLRTPSHRKLQEKGSSGPSQKSFFYVTFWILVVIQKAAALTPIKSDHCSIILILSHIQARLKTPSRRLWSSEGTARSRGCLPCLLLQLTPEFHTSFFYSSIFLSSLPGFLTIISNVLFQELSSGAGERLHNRRATVWPLEVLKCSAPWREWNGLVDKPGKMDHVPGSQAPSLTTPDARVEQCSGLSLKNK